SVAPVRTLTTSGSSWTATVASALTVDGSYTVQAFQSDSAGNEGHSAAKSRSEERRVGKVWMADPTSPTKDTKAYFTGTEGRGDGDLARVSITVVSSSDMSVAPVRTLTTSGSSWTATVASALTVDGSYTVQAFQSDSAGNEGHSAAKS